MLLKDVEGEYISLEHKGVTASPPALLEIEAGGNSLKLVLEHNSVALVWYKQEGRKLGTAGRKHSLRGSARNGAHEQETTKSRLWATKFGLCGAAPDCWAPGCQHNAFGLPFFQDFFINDSSCSHHLLLQLHLQGKHESHKVRDGSLGLNCTTGKTPLDFRAKCRTEFLVYPFLSISLSQAEQSTWCIFNPGGKCLDVQCLDTVPKQWKPGDWKRSQVVLMYGQKAIHLSSSSCLDAARSSARGKVFHGESVVLFQPFFIHKVLCISFSFFSSYSP